MDKLWTIRAGWATATLAPAGVDPAGRSRAIPRMNTVIATQATTTSPQITATRCRSRRSSRRILRLVVPTNLTGSRVGGGFGSEPVGASGDTASEDDLGEGETTPVVSSSAGVIRSLISP